MPDDVKTSTGLNVCGRRRRQLIPGGRCDAQLPRREIRLTRPRWPRRPWSQPCGTQCRVHRRASRRSRPADCADVHDWRPRTAWRHCRRKEDCRRGRHAYRNPQRECIRVTVNGFAIQVAICRNESIEARPGPTMNTARQPVQEPLSRLCSFVQAHLRTKQQRYCILTFPSNNQKQPYVV